MKRLAALLCVILGMALACKNDPPPRTTPSQTRQTDVQQTAPQQADQPKQTAPEPVQQTPSVASGVFDPSTISQEQKDTAKIEIQQLIQRLNGIIRAKNYNAWVSYLDRDYFATISSAEYLDRISKSSVLAKQGIVLKNARDYFNHVVVPSRDNDRVDDVEFVSPSRVKAYTVNTAGNRLRLYDLEQTGSGWKIIN